MSPISGVTIITPESPEFPNAIQSIADPAVLPDIQKVLPFCYVLKNNTEKFIVVYSTRWTLTDSSGRVTTQDWTWWNLATFRDGDAIAPGASRLVSPIFRLGVSRVGPTGPALTASIHRMLAAFGSKDGVGVSLETIVFEDGKALGSDATNAIAQAQAYLDGERQLADLVSKAVAERGDIRQLLSTLAAGPAGPRTYKLSNPPQYEESVAVRRQNLASSLLTLVPSDLPPADVLNRIQEQLNALQARVAAKRNINIAR